MVLALHSSASMHIKAKKLVLRTETIMTLQSADLDRVRGGQGDGSLGDITKPDTQYCEPSKSGPATCIPDRGGRGDRGIPGLE